MSWSCDWQLCFNGSKCKVMHSGWMNIERSCKLAYVEGILDMAEVDNERDLGVYLQSNLQFYRLVPNICAKANIIVGIIKSAIKQF